MTTLDGDGAWFNYVFDTDLDCARKCGPGAHPLYVGKSNDAHRRLSEHEKDKPWFRHSTGWRIYPERYATEGEALAAETRRIRALRPLANRAGNERNPCRLVFDHAATPVRPTRRRVTSSRRYAPVTRSSSTQTRTSAVAGTWLALAGVGWWQATVRLAVTGWHAPAFGALAATVLMVLAAALAAEVRSWWRSRRGRNQRRRWAAAMVRLSVTAGVLVLLWLLAPILLAHIPASSPR